MIEFLDSKDINVDKIKDFYCKYATWKITDRINDWKKIIEKSSCIITAWENDNLVGMARALSDEVRWATIVDVLVHPSYRSQSVGRSLIDKLLNNEKMNVRTIYLATPDKEKFYEHLGFKIANEHCSYMIKVNMDKDDYFLPIDRFYRNT